MDNINLSSFQPHKHLNSIVWDGWKLKEDVYKRLCHLSDLFVSKIQKPYIDIIDVVITGSLANYNWSRYSDFDIHVVIAVDYTQIDKSTITEYFNLYKKIWNSENENITIYGFPVEFYIQNVDEEHVSSGVFSIMYNKWITKPSISNFEHIEKSFDETERILTDILKRVEEYKDNYNKDKENRKRSSLLYAECKILIEKIKKVRKEGLSQEGEISPGNIAFKYLRRKGIINFLFTTKRILFNKIKSI